MEIIVWGAVVLAACSVLIGIWRTSEDTGRSLSLHNGLPYGWWKPRPEMLIPFALPAGVALGAWIGSLTVALF